MGMRCTVTNPDPRYVMEHGRRVDKTGVFDAKLNNGKVMIALGIGDASDFDLTGDQVGYLQAHGLMVDYAEGKAPPPVGSKKWRTAMEAEGKDPSEELAAMKAKEAKKSGKSPDGKRE